MYNLLYYNNNNNISMIMIINAIQDMFKTAYRHENWMKVRKKSDIIHQKILQYHTSESS